MTEKAIPLEVRAAHDPNAFISLYDRFYKRVYNYIRYRCDDLNDVEDLTSKVFERLVEKIVNYDPERGPFEAWLFTIVRNMVNNFYKAKKIRPWLPWEVVARKQAGGATVEESLIIRETEDEITHALSFLNDRERELLGLKFGSGFNNRQIAGLTGIKESNVAVILYRAIGHLRDALKNQHFMIDDQQLDTSMVVETKEVYRG